MLCLVALVLRPSASADLADRHPLDMSQHERRPLECRQAQQSLIDALPDLARQHQTIRFSFRRLDPPARRLLFEAAGS